MSTFLQISNFSQLGSQQVTGGISAIVIKLSTKSALLHQPHTSLEKHYVISNTNAIYTLMT